MSLDNQIIYKQLLHRHGQIRIPMIQRDYAQGRPAESAVRELFLGALEEALRKPADDPTLPLNLDFIYGSVENNGKKRFLPLDGQQRLTTLFLLHWYLAWRDNQWRVFEKLFLQDKHAAFVYDVRPSSNDFFDQLVGYQPAVTPDEVGTGELSLLITDQPWYFRRWRMDPTIQSVLCMLDAIHQRFVMTSGLFDRLVDEDQPAITFQLLDLENFGLSDDLYIKINARGKPLTAFETFKARYEQEIKGHLAGVTFDLGGHAFPAAEYVPRRMDTAWADLFWKHRNPQNNQYDDALMNVFRALALITRQVDSESYISDVKLLREQAIAPSYADFHARGWLDEPFTLALIRLLDAWSSKGGTLACLLPDGRFFDEQMFFGKVTTTPATLSYAEIIQFAAYVRFIVIHHAAIDPAAFQEWMRVICNLSTNTIYNRGEDFQRSMRALDVLLEYAGAILGYFAGAEKVVTGFNEQQTAEERLKAQLILADNRWRELIDRAERHGYFRGQIEFLLDFCGAMAAGPTADPASWDAAAHTTRQRDFTRYLVMAEKMFSPRGLIPIGDYAWQRALLTIGDYLLPSGRNSSFVVDSPTDEASWKRLLRGTFTKSPEPRVYLRELWDRLTPDAALAPQLDEVISARETLKPWLEAIVKWPEAIGYCESRNVRWMNTDTLYLLKRSQLNGAHAELFTYCLHLELLKEYGSFAVLRSAYYPMTVADWEPYVELSYELQGKRVEFLVFNRPGGYVIQIAKADCRSIPALDDTLRAAGYTEDGEWLVDLAGRLNMMDYLHALDEGLLELRKRV